MKRSEGKWDEVRVYMQGETRTTKTAYRRIKTRNRDKGSKSSGLTLSIADQPFLIGAHGQYFESSNNVVPI